MNDVEYVNGFSCALDESGMETVIILQRNLPVIDEDGDLTSIESEQIGTLVMSANTARNLVAALEEILGNDQILG